MKFFSWNEREKFMILSKSMISSSKFNQENFLRKFDNRFEGNKMTEIWFLLKVSHV